jgi:MFS family permease
LALVGFAGVGAGFANVVPILFAASARVPEIEPARGIAAVSAAAYLGFMAGPPVIGFLAEVSSLTAALYVVVAFAVGLARVGTLGRPGLISAAPARCALHALKHRRAPRRTSWRASRPRSRGGCSR